jgi:gliding motility-associated-like protein/uncharacterized repeat protein (TIGR01451 family)
MPDTVCAGIIKQYHVDSNIVPGSTYSWRINGVTQISSTSNKIDILWNNAGTFLLEVQELSVNGCFGPVKSGQVFVSPLPVLTASATQQPSCSIASGTITVTTPPAIGTTYSIDGFTYSNTSGIFTQLAAGTYLVTSKNSTGCISAAISITINKQPPTPVAPTASATLQPTCTVSTGTITITAPSGPGLTYSIDGSDYSNTTGIFTLVPVGIYSVTVKNADNCISAPTTVTIIANVCIADLSILKTVNISHPIINQAIVFTITVINNGPDDATGVSVSDLLQSGYTYVSSSASKGTFNNSIGLWTIGTFKKGESEILTIHVTVNSTGTYTNTATINGNEDDVNPDNNISWIKTYPENFFIPEGFSPNGDFINDVFVIRGIENYPENTFVIFNRWGNKVFEKKHYLNTWDGRATTGLILGGDDLPIGTYFYILDLGDGTDVYKGTIYLNR